MTTTKSQSDGDGAMGVVLTDLNIIPPTKRKFAKKQKQQRPGKTSHPVWVNGMSILDREWHPAKAARADEQKERTAKERFAKKARAEGKYTGPQKTVLDPHCMTHVAVLSDDKGTPEFLRRVVEDLLEFASPDDFPEPLKGMEVYFGDRHYHANVRRDHIDLLYDKGGLSKAAYCAARELKAAYQESKDVRCGSVNMNRTGNGRIDDAAIVDRKIRATKKYTAMLDVVKGGKNSYDSLFVMWFCCYEKSLSWIAKTYHVRKEDALRRSKEGLEEIARAYLKPGRTAMQGIAAEGLKIPDETLLLTPGTSQG